MKKTFGSTCLLAVSFWSPPHLMAQAPAPSPSAEAQADAMKSILEQELQPPPGGYSYNPQGRRDPFVSLIKPVGPETRGGIRKGLEGFMIQEVALKGIVKTPDGYIALLQGADGKTYFPKVGQRLFDGSIVSMDAATVTFRQEVTDPLSPVRTRDLKKSLYVTEEARQ